jgi:hypothetical protein
MIEWEGGIDVCNDTQLMKFCTVSVLILHVYYLDFMFPACDMVQVTVTTSVRGLRLLEPEHLFLLIYLIGACALAEKIRCASYVSHLERQHCRTMTIIQLQIHSYARSIFADTTEETARNLTCR